jgi:Rne/Rng family ribonuclease
MAKEICISSTPHETRLAILEDDQLAEIYYERENEYTLAGSIYNGRVTRVLPGMQSAFVDVGLERDAFLYVTDFLELEDPEESDELEKAAVSGGNQAPREVRHSNGAAGRGEENGQRPSQRQDQKPDQSRDRPSRDRRIIVEPATDAGPPPPLESPFTASPAEEAKEESGDPGAKRWRGRRRRRGGRGAAGTPEGQSGSETSSEDLSETQESASSQEIQASAGAGDKSAPQNWSAPSQASAPASTPSTRGTQVPVPFVLPGESLRKYGGAAAEDESPKSAPAAPPRAASAFRPATLVEAPLAWDGSGLLPGESISRHRNRPPEPEAEVYSELKGVFSDALPDTGDQAPKFSAGSALEPSAHLGEHYDEEVLDEPSEEEPVLDEAVAQYEEAGDEPPIVDEPLTEESSETALHEIEFEESESTTPDSDASASHHVDPSSPTGFRLFGLGSKKKTEEPAPVPPPPTPAPRQAAVATVSAYAPGAGPIVEEVIEEEEFDAPHHHHSKADEHDLDDYEEETLPVQLRTGDLGEMLQEAHLDHKIQLNFDDKNVEDESFDEEEDEDDDAVAEGQPTAGQGQDSSQQRRDRGGRGRRGGRGGPGQQQGGQGQRRSMTRRSAQTSDLPIISDLLKPGQEILVQIAKEPIAKKGARITSHIALPGRFLVFMPTVSHIGVSRKIASDEERQRLKRILVHERGEAAGGFIVRTAAEGASEEELRADLRFLIHLWDEIKQRSESSKSPALIYHDLSLIERILRDQVSSNFSSIWVDSQDDYERIVRFLNRFSPNLVRRVKLYTKEVPLFEHFGIQEEISKALRSKVWLKSGGSIVINQTEALVAIDINTGKYVGKSARLEDTILKTNLDAVPEIVRQIRLRDLGGIIVIDFIDMDERKNRFKVMAALEEALKSDRAPTKVLQFNDFGLVAITRKRVKQSLERTLSVPCPTCQATGMVKSPTTVCNEIYIELRKMKKHFEGADVLLRVNPETVKVLKQNNASWLNEFEELVGKNILVKSDATLHPEQFDIQG